jgi:hypothetical protein
MCAYVLACIIPAARNRIPGNTARYAFVNQLGNGAGGDWDGWRGSRRRGDAIVAVRVLRTARGHEARRASSTVVVHNARGLNTLGTLRAPWPLMRSTMAPYGRLLIRSGQHPWALLLRRPPLVHNVKRRYTLTAGLRLSLQEHIGQEERGPYARSFRRKWFSGEDQLVNNVAAALFSGRQADIARPRKVYSRPAHKE